MLYLVQPRELLKVFRFVERTRHILLNLSQLQRHLHQVLLYILQETKQSSPLRSDEDLLALLETNFSPYLVRRVKATGVDEYSILEKESDDTHVSDHENSEWEEECEDSPPRNNIICIAKTFMLYTWFSSANSEGFQ